MKIIGSSVYINDFEIDMNKSLEDAVKFTNQKINNGTLTIEEETSCGCIVWKISRYESNPYLLGSVLFEKEKGSWRFWTREEEMYRKKLQDKILETWGIQKGVVGALVVDNFFDPKGGFSAISIQ